MKLHTRATAKGSLPESEARAHVSPALVESKDAPPEVKELLGLNKESLKHSLMAIGWWIQRDTQGNPCVSYRYTSQPRREQLFQRLGKLVDGMSNKELRDCRRDIGYAYLVWKHMRNLQDMRYVARGEHRFHWYPRGNFAITAQAVSPRSWEALEDATTLASNMFDSANPERTHRDWYSPGSEVPTCNTPGTEQWRTPVPEHYQDFAGGSTTGLPVFQHMTGRPSWNAGRTSANMPTEEGEEEPLR